MSHMDSYAQSNTMSIKKFFNLKSYSKLDKTKINTKTWIYVNIDIPLLILCHARMQMCNWTLLAILIVTQEIHMTLSI